MATTVLKPQVVLKNSSLLNCAKVYANRVTVRMVWGHYSASSLALFRLEQI